MHIININYVHDYSFVPIGNRKYSYRNREKEQGVLSFVAYAYAFGSSAIG